MAEAWVLKLMEPLFPPGKAAKAHLQLAVYMAYIYIPEPGEYNASAGQRLPSMSVKKYLAGGGYRRPV